jgi:hypothetical protein
MDPPPASTLSRSPVPGAWLRRLPGGHSLCVGALALSVAWSGPPPFTPQLPKEMPDVSRWRKSSGSAELADGSASVQYELYVNPDGSGGYELIRWRITGWDGGRGGAPYSSNERLQWQVAQKVLRRYQCDDVGGERCVWREMMKDTEEYHREMPVILWVLSVHQRLAYPDN